jgi:hypothetical protein
MKRAGAILLAVLALALAAGCGGDDESGSNDPNGIDQMSPQQALATTANALRKVKSFHIEANQGRSTSVIGDIGEDRVRLDLKERDASARMLLVDGSFYIRGNTAFWRQSDAAQQASELDGRWLKLPAASGELRQVVERLQPENLSRCLSKEHGTLSLGGTAAIEGRPAVTIVDAGNKPGTTPGRLYVAATGEPLPLRTVASGNEKPGGDKDPLCDGDSRTRNGDQVLFSRFNLGVKVTAPPNAIDLGARPGGQSS